MTRVCSRLPARRVPHGGGRPPVSRPFRRRAPVPCPGRSWPSRPQVILIVVCPDSESRAAASSTLAASLCVKRTGSGVLLRKLALSSNRSARLAGSGLRNGAPPTAPPRARRPGCAVSRSARSRKLGRYLGDGQELASVRMAGHCGHVQSVTAPYGSSPSDAPPVRCVGDASEKGCNLPSTCGTPSLTEPERRSGPPTRCC